MGTQDIEPENRTKCSATQGEHVWTWDDDADDWRCDECGVTEDRQKE